jgi:hypothetical protein
MSEVENTKTDTTSSASIPDEAKILQRMISDLTALPEESRKRLIDTVCVFLGLGNAVGDSVSGPGSQYTTSNRATEFQFSEDDAPPIKQFLTEKNPQTDVERVACLAYYLARYRATPHLKTKDITEINKESAHRPFSNTAFAVDNATKAGYLVPSIKGSKQISAYGERFVEALPDHDAAKEIMAAARAGRRTKSTKRNAAAAA